MSDIQAPTRAEMRAAVAYGQQLAVRNLLDALNRERPKRDGWRLVYESDDTIPSSMSWEPDMHCLQQNGYDEAVRVVKAYRIDGKAEAE